MRLSIRCVAPTWKWGLGGLPMVLLVTPRAQRKTGGYGRGLAVALAALLAGGSHSAQGGCNPTTTTTSTIPALNCLTPYSPCSGSCSNSLCIPEVAGADCSYQHLGSGNICADLGSCVLTDCRGDGACSAGQVCILGFLSPLAAPQLAAPRVHPILASVHRRPPAAGRVRAGRSAVRCPVETPVSVYAPTRPAWFPRRPRAAARAPVDSTAVRSPVRPRASATAHSRRCAHSSPSGAAWVAEMGSLGTQRASPSASAAACSSLTLTTTASRSSRTRGRS